MFSSHMWLLAAIILNVTVIGKLIKYPLFKKGTRANIKPSIKMTVEG